MLKKLVMIGDLGWSKGGVAHSGDRYVRCENIRPVATGEFLPERSLAASKLADKSQYDDRSAALDAERRLFEREESFYWAWQYPGQL